ncbi:MAG: hypothetical protein JST04_02020 [Bdellovibrionales bacterium]|nr:hypothetical protein [Bdellovibrionales bacterium]
MRILDLYSHLRASLERGERGYAAFEADEAFRPLLPIARDWGIDHRVVADWFASPEGVRGRAVAEGYLAVVRETVAKIERIVGRELPGTLVPMPSFGDFDGFARYELGEHRVLLGIDFPDADVDYLRALTAHELSHVFRDHSPGVWGHLGKPLRELTRKEYLNATTALEHLASEGLATLFSQAVFPEIEPRVHHFYEAGEWDWCLANDGAIERALLACLAGDGDVWSFYGESRVARGSPSRTQYYWAAKRLSTLLGTGEERLGALLRLHGQAAAEFRVFQSS